MALLAVVVSRTNLYVCVCVCGKVGFLFCQPGSALRDPLLAIFSETLLWSICFFPFFFLRVVLLDIDNGAI